MISDLKSRSRTILTSVVHSFLKDQGDSVFSFHWDLCGQVRNENGYFGYMAARRQSGQEIKIFFHTDDIYNPTWIAIIVPRYRELEESLQSDPTLIPEYLQRNHTESSSEFLFFDLSDFDTPRHRGSKSGVVIGDKRVGSDGNYINHGWERYQHTKLFSFRAAINNAKL
jgi:hypothetical protein